MLINVLKATAFGLFLNLNCQPILAQVDESTRPIYLHIHTMKKNTNGKLCVVAIETETMNNRNQCMAQASTMSQTNANANKRYFCSRNNKEQFEMSNATAMCEQ